MNSAETEAARDELAEVYTPEGVEIFLRSPHKRLDGRCAIDCEFHDVMRIIEQLQTGAMG